MERHPRNPLNFREIVEADLHREVWLIINALCSSYEAKLTERTYKLTSISGPAATVFIAAIIGTFIVSIRTTILSINQMISRSAVTLWLAVGSQAVHHRRSAPI
jgi:hypothetical protein